MQVIDVDTYEYTVKSSLTDQLSLTSISCDLQLQLAVITTLP